LRFSLQSPLSEIVGRLYACSMKPSQRAIESGWNWNGQAEPGCPGTPSTTNG
jgi:hypothetical protein